MEERDISEGPSQRQDGWHDLIHVLSTAQAVALFERQAHQYRQQSH